MSKPSLIDLLDNNLPEPPPSNEPIHKLERPSFRRDGLFGRTPFKVREAELVAVTTEQVCLCCGSTHLGFGGIFREYQGTVGVAETTTRTLVDGPVLKTQIDRVTHVTEKVPYCPTCLGKGD